MGSVNLARRAGLGRWEVGTKSLRTAHPLPPLRLVAAQRGRMALHLWQRVKHVRHRRSVPGVLTNGRRPSASSVAGGRRILIATGDDLLILALKCWAGRVNSLCASELGFGFLWSF
jgi:hypothetical protein